MLTRRFGFILQRLQETLDLGGIVRIPAPAQAEVDPVGFEQVGVSRGGLLPPWVRVVDEAWAHRTRCQRHVHGCPG